jgi:hypothetical protein
MPLDVTTGNANQSAATQHDVVSGDALANAATTDQPRTRQRRKRR